MLELSVSTGQQKSLDEMKIYGCEEEYDEPLKTQWNPYHCPSASNRDYARASRGAGTLYCGAPRVSGLRLNAAEAGHPPELRGQQLPQACKAVCCSIDNVYKSQLCLASNINLENITVATSPTSLKFHANILVAHANLELCKRGAYEKCSPMQLSDNGTKSSYHI